MSYAEMARKLLILVLDNKRFLFFYHSTGYIACRLTLVVLED